MLASPAGPKIAPPGALGDLHADMDEAGLQLLAFSALGEPLERVFAQDRMEAEARLDLLDRGAVRAVRAGGADLDPDEALVGERLEAGQHVDSEITVWIRHGPGGVGGPAAGEHGKPGEQPAFFRGEQVVAPRTAPRSVRCRSGWSRVPPARSRLRPSRSRIDAGLMTRTRAAASSSASGRPSRRSLIVRIAASVSSPG